MFCWLMVAPGMCPQGWQPRRHMHMLANGTPNQGHTLRHRAHLVVPRLLHHRGQQAERLEVSHLVARPRQPLQQHLAHLQHLDQALQGGGNEHQAGMTMFAQEPWQRLRTGSREPVGWASFKGCRAS